MERERLIALPEVKQRTSLGKTTIYERIAAGTFPRPVKLGERRVAWLESEVEAWIRERIEERG